MDAGGRASRRSRPPRSSRGTAAEIRPPPDDDVRLSKAHPARFQCSCSEERRQRAADDRQGGGREHPRRAGPGRRHLRVLQPALHVRRRDARALFASDRGAVQHRGRRDGPTFRRISTRAIAPPSRDSARSSVRHARDPEGRTTVSHVPLIWPAASHGTLLGHFARANPHVEQAPGAESIAIFHGPHAYVSPSWYAEPAVAVPTWNYAVVHAHGTLELAREPGETRAILDLLIHRFESSRAAPWAPGLDRAQMAAMVAAIVGFRIRVRRLDAVCCRRTVRLTIARVATALTAEGYAEAKSTAEWMHAYVPGADSTR
jgi:transcriptional regulator